MLDTLLRHYFGRDAIPKLRPIDFDVCTPWDYHLYLFQIGNLGWFVIVESDFLFLIDIPKDTQEAFGVKVEGWCTLFEYQKATGEKLLPPNIFSDYDLRSKDDYEYYNEVVYKHKPTSMRYALLKVSDNAQPKN
jgi:hypothetical protein